MGYRSIVLDTVLSLAVASGTVAVVDALSAIDTAAEINKVCAQATDSFGARAGCECDASRRATGRSPAQTTAAHCRKRAGATEARERAEVFGADFADPATVERRALLLAGLFIAARIARRRLRLYQVFAASSNPIGSLAVSSPATARPHSDTTRQSSSVEQ
jgi:hypothetical protein